MKYEPEDLKVDLKTRFGVEELSPEQAWVLVKIVKHGRLRCRNNAALNNFMRKAFAHLRFDQVEKRKADGSFYEGLSISYRDGAKQAPIMEGDDE
jgi:hypothetical protein